MARLRFLLVAAFVLVMVGCPLLEQQENFISFTLDGVQYIFTASDDSSGHPYAVGYTNLGEVVSYIIWGSATAAEAQDDESTLNILLNHVGYDWWVRVVYYDGEGNDYYYPILYVHEDEIDSFIANRNVVGAQFAGSMPGPFTGEAPELRDIIFSVERLPNEESLR